MSIQWRHDDDRLAAVAEGCVAPDLSAPGERALAEWAWAARGPAQPDELGGLDAALAAYAATQARAGRGGVRPLVRIGVAAAAASLLLGGTAAAAAYRGVLPGGAQRLAHEVIGAPPADDASAGANTPDVSASVTPPAGAEPGTVDRTSARSPSSEHSATPSAHPTTVPPAGTVGASAAALCHAWSVSAGHPDKRSAVVGSLSALAGGTHGIAAFCATTGAPTQVSPPGHAKDHSAPGPGNGTATGHQDRGNSDKTHRTAKVEKSQHDSQHTAKGDKSHKASKPKPKHPRRNSDSASRNANSAAPGKLDPHGAPTATPPSQPDHR